MDGYADGTLAHVGFAGEIVVGYLFAMNGEKFFPPGELLAFLGAEIIEDFFEEGVGPFAVVEFIGAELVGGFELEAFLSAFPIDGEVLGEPAALELVVLAPLLGGVVLESAQEEGPKAALLLIGEAESIFLNERGEESLHEIFSIRGTSSGAPEVAIEREPVDFAERGQAGGRRLFITFTRGVDDEGPSGGGEV